MNCSNARPERRAQTSAAVRRARLARALGLSLVLACLINPARAVNTEIAGVRYDPTIKVEGQTLQLNGSGLSYRALQKVYTVGLYVPKKSSNADEVLAAPGPKQLRFVMLVPMRVDDLGKLIARGLEANSSREEFRKLIPAAVDMGRIFSHMKRMVPGDTIAIEYVPQRGTVFFVNGQPSGLPIQGPDFFAAVLRVWIGKVPPTQDLKDALLDYKAPPLLDALD